MPKIYFKIIVAVVFTLLSNNALCSYINVNGSIHVAENTYLHFAALHNNVESAKALLNYGANINKKDSNGNTALHHAAISGHRNIVTLLLGRKADPCIRNKQGRTPYDLAIQKKHTQIADLLTECLL